MKQKEKNISIFEFAQEYLFSILPAELRKEDLEKYFVGDCRAASSIEEVYIVFLSSAQNYQRMPNVIQFENRREVFAKLLHQFDVEVVADMDETELYQKLRSQFNVTTADTKHNSWYKWSCSAIDSARFLRQFRDINDFRDFVGRFSYNASTRMALPLFLSVRIRGMGFALACNTLKELGYSDYPKPDVHIIDICEALGLSSKDPYDAFEAIVRIAEDNNVSPYKVDKVFWLICSGKFYLDGVEIKRHKKEFIQAEIEMLRDMD